MDRPGRAALRQVPSAPPVRGALRVQQPRHCPGRQRRKMRATMQKTIVLLGGGFAGVYAAGALERLLPRDWDLVLFSQENHFTFTPLLAEVVGASISPLHVVRP